MMYIIGSDGILYLGCSLVICINVIRNIFQTGDVKGKSHVILSYIKKNTTTKAVGVIPSPLHYYCQAHPKLQVNLSLKAELALLSLLYQQHHHPTGIVVF